MGQGILWITHRIILGIKITDGKKTESTYNIKHAKSC